MIEDCNIVKTLKENDTIAIVPRGNSMWPFIKNGEQSVVLKAKTKERAKKFDVIFFQRENGKVVLHRVIEVLDDGYVVRGDSQFYTEKVDEERVFAVMIGFYKGKKYIEANDEKYLKKFRRWNKSCVFYRKVRVKLYFIGRKFCEFFHRKAK